MSSSFNHRAGALLGALVLLAAAAGAQDDGAGDEAAYEVLADTAVSDGDGRFVFTGGVSIDGAGLQLRADQLIYDDRGLYEARGEPATVELDGADGPVAVSAPVIEYDSEAGALRLPAGGTMRGGGYAVAAAGMEYAVQSGDLTATGGVELDGGDGVAGKADAVTARLGGAALRLRLAGTPARLSLPAAADGPPIEAEAAAIAYAAGELRLEGGPASLSYPDAESGGMLAATAETIVFAEAAGTIVMEGGAQAQLGTESIASERITFDAATGAFSAAPAEGERVKATIKLRQ